MHHRLLRLRAPPQDADVEEAAERRAEQREPGDEQPRRAAPHQSTRATSTKQDGGGDRHVERLRSRRRGGSPPGGSRRPGVTNRHPRPRFPRPVPPGRHARVRRPAPAARRRRRRSRSPPCARRPTREARPRFAATAGSRKSAPMLPRTTFGLVSSAVPFSATTPAAPRPSAERRIVPTLPGSCTPSSTRTGRPGAGRISVSVQRRGSITATTPCGCSVSASVSSSPSLTVSTRTAAPFERALERPPAGGTFQRGRDRRPRGAAARRRAPLPPDARPPRAPVLAARGRAGGADRGSSSAEGSLMDMLAR